MKYLDYQGLQEYDALIKQYIQDNIPDSSQAADVATALKNAYNTNATIKVAVCTQAEYNALQNPEQNVLYIISDETSEVVNVEANPTLAGTESVLSSIKIGGIKYKVSSIEANPTLSGNETTLTGLGINGVNYAMPSGGSSSGGSATLYEHFIQFSESGVEIAFTFLTSQDVVFTNISSIVSFVKSNNLRKNYLATGIYRNNDVNYRVLLVGFAKGLYGNTADYSYDTGTSTSLTFNSRGLSNVTSVTDTITQIF